MVEIGLKINPVDLDRLLNKLRRLSPKEQTSTFAEAWHAATRFVTRKMIDNASGKILHRRTGALSKIQYTIDKKKIVSIIGNRVISGNPVPYAAIHEYGGTIRPTRAKNLAIPIGRAKTAAGVARFRPRDIERSGYDDSVCFRSKAGNLILWGVKNLKTKKKLTPLFVLKKSVRVPARHWVSKTVKESQAGVVTEMERWIDKEIKK